MLPNTFSARVRRVLRFESNSDRYAGSMRVAVYCHYQILTDGALFSQNNQTQPFLCCYYSFSVRFNHIATCIFLSYYKVYNSVLRSIFLMFIWLTAYHSLIVVASLFASASLRFTRAHTRVNVWRRPVRSCSNWFSPHSPPAASSSRPPLTLRKRAAAAPARRPRRRPAPHRLAAEHRSGPCTRCHCDRIDRARSPSPR